MTIKATTVILVTIISFAAKGQGKPADTVIVPLAETSKIIFTIQDRSDLLLLRHYNFQELFEDILQRIEESDTLRTDSSEIIVSQKDDENWSTSTSKED